MTKEHPLQMTLLFDYYAELLTEKQKTYFDLYHNQDLSLAEIAEETGISRQGVHDALSKAEQALLEFEQKLGCFAKEQRLHTQLQIIREAAEELQGTPQADRILNAVRELKE